VVARVVSRGRKKERREDPALKLSEKEGIPRWVPLVDVGP